MSKAKSLWQADFIILLRWIIFVPIGFILTATLQVIPPMGVELVKSNMPESTLLTIVGALLVIPILLVLGGVWFKGVLMIPYLNCRYIAPSNGIATVLYGILFCLFEGVFLLSSLAGGVSWRFIGYQLLFSGITVGGIIIAYKEIDPSRYMRWIPWWTCISSQTPDIVK